VGSSKPRLSFVLAAGRGAPLLKTVSVALPGGLSFSRSRSTVSVTGRGGRRLRFTVSLRHGTLVLGLRSPGPQARVTIAFPRIRSSAGLAAHHSTLMTLTVRVTDALRRTTPLKTRVRARS
jgi:hypothetical protein